MYEDDAGPDVCAGMDVDPAHAPLRPMPTAVPPPPLGSCEQRHCRYHAAEGAHRHRLMGTGRRGAGMLASALERYELQRPGQVAREVALVAESPDDDQVRCVQLGDAAVLGHHPGDVRAAEPQEGLPLSVRLSVGRLLDEAGLEDVRRDEGLYVALWRGGADAWRREQAVRPLTPQALGSHALLVVVHPEGAKVVFGADRLLLAGDGVVLVPTSSSYRLESRGGDLKLLVVVGTRLDESAAPQGSEHAVPVGSDEETARDDDEVGREQPTGEEQQQDQPEVAGEEVDVQAIVAAALARLTVSRARRRRRRHWRRRTNAGGVNRHRAPWSRTRRWRSWGRRRRGRWVHGSWEWRTRLGRRRGRWKPAGTGPRVGACGQTPAGSHTPSRRCRGEYPRNCS